MGRLRAICARYREARAEADRRRTLRNIRETLALLGHPVYDMTDEEIEAGCVRAAEAMRHVGISADEAAERLRMVGMVLRENDAVTQ